MVESCWWVEVKRDAQCVLSMDEMDQRVEVTRTLCMIVFVVSTSGRWQVVMSVCYVIHCM